MKQIHVIISGRVQGVFFRAETKSEADSLGLTGWVRNLPTGAVEAVFEGPEAAVTTMVGWCRRGPAHARVDNLVVTERPFTGAFKDFQIRY